MRCLGIVPSTTAVYVCVVVASDGVVRAADFKRMPIPKNADESQRLSALYKLSSTMILEYRVERISILQAGRSKFGGPSALRVKVECVMQLAAMDQAITVAVVAPQSLRAFEKKHEPMALLSDGEFSSKEMRDAALVAWLDLVKHGSI